MFSMLSELVTISVIDPNVENQHRKEQTIVAIRFPEITSVPYSRVLLDKTDILL